MLDSPINSPINHYQYHTYNVFGDPIINNPIKKIRFTLKEYNNWNSVSPRFTFKEYELFRLKMEKFKFISDIPVKLNVSWDKLDEVDTKALSK